MSLYWFGNQLSEEHFTQFTSELWDNHLCMSSSATTYKIVITKYSLTESCNS